MSDMQDLVKRLRNQAVGAESGPSSHWTSPELLREAADEIERLRAEAGKKRLSIDEKLEALRLSIESMGATTFMLREENDLLREKVKILEQAMQETRKALIGET